MIEWTKGECGECGDEMKVLNSYTQRHFGSGTCKQCKLLEKFERIAYALELQVGIE